MPKPQRPNPGRKKPLLVFFPVEVIDAIRAACPGVVINQTTGINGPDISGPTACLRAVMA